MTLHGTNLRMILLFPAERRLICHLLWQWRGTSLVVPLHLDNPHNAGPLVWRRIHQTIISNGAWRYIFGPGSQSVPLLVFAFLHTLLQHPLPTASSSSVTSSSSSLSLPLSLQGEGSLPPLCQCCCFSADWMLWARHWPLYDHMSSRCRQPKGKHWSAAVALSGPRDGAFRGVSIAKKIRGTRGTLIDVNMLCVWSRSSYWHARWDPPAGINSQHYESTLFMFARPPLEGLRSILHVISVWLWL